MPSIIPRIDLVRLAAVCMIGLGLIATGATEAGAQARSATLTTGSATAGPGDSIVVPLSIGELIGTSELEVIKLAVEFDSALLEGVDAVPGAAIAGWPAADLDVQLLEGRVVVSAVTDTPVALTEGELFSLQLQVRDEVLDGASTQFDIVGVADGDPVVLQADVLDDATRTKVLTVDGDFTIEGGLICSPGDVLVDGEIDVADAVVLLRIVVDLIPEPGVLQLCNADADQSGAVDAGDAVVVLRRVVGLARSAPVAALDARLVRDADGARIVVDDAGAVHGLSLDVEGHAVARGVSAQALGVSSELDGRTRLAFASMSPLTSGEPLVIELERAATTDFDGLSLFAADGSEIDVRLSEDRSAVSTRGAVALTNYPNPFNPSTTISYSLPTASRARLELFNARGERVALLVDGRLPAGPGQIVWNGTDANGRTVASGVYFAQLVTDDGTVARQRLMLLK